MAYTTLPAYPLVLFGIIEPALLIYASYIGYTNPLRYFTDQVPNSPTDLSPQALALTLQTMNIFLLLAAMAVICCWTKDANVTRFYLVAVAFADLGHVYAVYRGMGPEAFWDWREWNDMVASNVGVSLFLHVNRWATVAGLFGKLIGEEKVKTR